MVLRIPGWTDRHSLVALPAVLALVAAAAGVAEGRIEGLLLVGAAAAVFAIGLAGDAWVGLIVGLGAAALVIFVRQAAGSWVPGAFALAAVESAALIGTGWAAGRAGSGLRVARAFGTHDGDEAGAVFGSIGMLPADLALVRLEEEVSRARSYRRPLSVAILAVETVDPELDADGRNEVFRAVARVAETMLREMDVPFLFAANRIGAILPETGGVAAAIATSRILEAVSTGGFIHRRRNQRQSLAGAVAVRLAVVSLTPSVRTAGDLLDRAIAALERVRPGS